MDKDEKFNQGDYDNIIDFQAYLQDGEFALEADETEKEIKAAVRRIKLRKLILVFGVLILLGISFFLYVLYLKERKYTKATTKYSRLKSEVFAGYTNMGNSLVRYGKDGVILVDESGKEVFNTGYNMKTPIADSCEAYLAIADLGGNTAYLFDGSGQLCSVTSTFPIVDVRASNSGIMMLISEDDEKTYTSFYYKDGKELAQSQHPLSKKRFPICFDISYKGKQAAIGFLSYDKTELLSTLAILGFDPVGETKPNNVVFSYDIGTERLLDLEYNSEGRLLVITDEGFHIYKEENQEAGISEVSFDRLPRSVLYNDSYIVCITEEDEAKTLRFYDYAGKLLYEMNLLIDYQKVLLNKDWVVFVDDNEMVAFDSKGRLKMEYMAGGSIKDVKPMNDRLHYLVVYEGKMELIQFK